MASNPIVWTPPHRRVIRNVVAGSVVSAQFRPAPGSAGTLGPDARGVCPHLVITPSVAPVGTGGYNMIGPFGEVEEAVGDPPMEDEMGAITGENPEFWVDFGVPILCPWDCAIEAEGGTIADGTVQIDVQTFRSTPTVITNTTPFPTSMLPLEWLQAAARDEYAPVRTMYRQYGPTNLSPIGQPTISFVNVPVGGTPIQLPRGVHKVQVSQSTDIVFTSFGTSVTVRLTPGTPMPLGFMSQGTFAASAANITLVSFYVAIA